MDMEFRRIAVPTSEYVEKREEGDMTFVCLEATEKDGMIDAIECAVLTDEMDMEEIDAKCTEWKLAQDKEAIAMAVEDKLSQITLYDKSAAVNSFLLNGMEVWLDKATRVGLMNSTTIAKSMGQEKTTLWLGSYQLEVDCDKAIQLLSALEMYALECFNVTAAHKKAVSELANIEAVLTYDYKSGYPDKLKMEV